MIEVYASRKLLSREQTYSLIEKDCLAVGWEIGKFQDYRFERDFVLKTVHQPVLYINKDKVANTYDLVANRQSYLVQAELIRGVENVRTDYLIRM